MLREGSEFNWTSEGVKRSSGEKGKNEKETEMEQGRARADSRTGRERTGPGNQRGGGEKARKETPGRMERGRADSRTEADWANLSRKGPSAEEDRNEGVRERADSRASKDPGDPSTRAGGHKEQQTKKQMSYTEETILKAPGTVRAKPEIGGETAVSKSVSPTQALQQRGRSKDAEWSPYLPSPIDVPSCIYMKEETSSRSIEQDR